jgi:uncharacterized protein YigA (DUF484 family)
MQSQDVAKYLLEHPEFFDEYAELLASVEVPHPYGGHAIPLSERQVLSLRDKSRMLEGKLRELVQFGESNDVISDRVHRMSLTLLAAADAPGLVACVRRNLREDFGVPAAALRIWGVAALDGTAEATEVSAEARVFAESLTGPYFSEGPMFDSAAWFESATAPLRAFVYVPLRAERSLGVLAMASPDPARFTPDMGTLYLTRLGELVSMALKRYA